MTIFCRITVPLQAGASIRFSCSKEQGAALIIKQRAYREDLNQEGTLERLMIKNHRHWLMFMQSSRGLSVNLSDIVFVKGYDLTAEWAITTFAKSDGDTNVDFTVGDSLGIAQVFASGWVKWESSQGVGVRCGPNYLRPPSLTEDPSTKTSAQGPVPFNQCIFLRGFRVISRRLLPNELEAAAEPEDMERHHDTEEDGSVLVPADYDVNDDAVEEVESFVIHICLSSPTVQTRSIYDMAAEYIFKVR